MICGSCGVHNPHSPCMTKNTPKLFSLTNSRNTMVIPCTDGKNNITDDTEQLSMWSRIRLNTYENT